MCLDGNICKKFEECERDHYNPVTNKTAANWGLCLGHTVALHHGMPDLKDRLVQESGNMVKDGDTLPTELKTCFDELKKMTRILPGSVPVPTAALIREY